MNPRTSPVHRGSLVQLAPSSPVPLNYHGTPPSPVSILPSDRKRHAEPISRPAPIKMMTAEDDVMDEVEHDTRISTMEFIERECEKHGWNMYAGRARPTTDPFKLLALCSINNPWHDHRSLHLISPQQMSSCLENVYAKATSIIHGLRFNPRKGDLLVCGVYRSGLTPALQVLASLKHGQVIEKNALVEVADWLEAAYPAHSPAFKRNDVGDRILKSHMPLRTLFGGVITPSPRGSRPEFHVVVMLRDPLDVRLSWFRHVRRVYRKFNRDGADFDAHFSVDDFASVQLCSINPNITSVLANHADYENFVVESIRATMQEPNASILLCFYEELLLNPSAFVKKISDFTGLATNNPLLLDQITRALVEDEDFPATFASPATPMTQPSDTSVSTTGIHPFASAASLAPERSHRKGCAGQGRLVFPKDSQRRIESKWRDIVSHEADDCLSYERLVLTTSSICQQLLVPPPAQHQPRSRAGTAMSVLLSAASLPRIGSFTSFFKSTPKHASENGDSELDGTTEEESESNSQIAVLFPSVDVEGGGGGGGGGTVFATESNPRARARTSSLMSFGSMFRETLTHQAGSSFRAGSSRGLHPSAYGAADVDPDDSDEDNELNMFLDLSRSRMYHERKTLA
jgi:hypothetical protein